MGIIVIKAKRAKNSLCLRHKKLTLKLTKLQPNYSKTCGDSGWRKDSNKIAYKNAEKVRFYKGLMHFQNSKDCQDQLQKIE